MYILYKLFIIFFLVSMEPRTEPVVDAGSPATPPRKRFREDSTLQISEY